MMPAPITTTSAAAGRRSSLSMRLRGRGMRCRSRSEIDAAHDIFLGERNAAGFLAVLYAPVPQDEEAIGDGESQLDILLHDHHGDTAPFERRYDRCDLADESGGEAAGRLVEEE